MRDLTDRQRRVLDFIVRHGRDTGRPPTLREIGGEFGFRSTGTVRQYLRALEAKGALRRERGKARGIAPTGRSRGVPILGRVAAGTPLSAEENVEGYFDAHLAAASRPGLFALRVKGDSMSDAGILDGDTVLVRRGDTARHGEIVVALIGDEATVKRLRLEKGRAFLDPANPRYASIPASGEARIAGKVVGVWRSLV